MESKRSQGQLRRYAKPEVREKLRAAWNRPEVREKRCAGIARARAEGRCPGRPNGFQEDNVLCAACRSGNHLACDGGECRCVCALELDVKLPRKWRAAAGVAVAM